MNEYQSSPSLLSERKRYELRKIENLAEKINNVTDVKERERILTTLRETFNDERSEDRERIDKMTLKQLGYDDHTLTNGPDIATAFDIKSCRDLEEQYSLKPMSYKFVRLAKRLILKSKEATKICIKQV